MVMLWQPTHLTFMQVSKIYEVVPPILLETGKVRSNVGLVLSFFLNTIWTSIMKISHLFILLGYGYTQQYFLYSISFGSIHHARTSIPRQNHPCINMV